MRFVRNIGGCAHLVSTWGGRKFQSCRELYVVSQQLNPAYRPKYAMILLVGTCRKGLILRKPKSPEPTMYTQFLFHLPVS